MQNTVLKFDKDDKFLLALKWRHEQKNKKPDMDLMAIKIKIYSLRMTLYFTTT